ncbi:MAG TPA: bifunctional serine/threonine-protein kinase/formylglycine-generating enzyme family protein [Planctomycetota bacterium]|nr:bifunctional serine/threonine-protein kinase/formylglycine-generating enzyme family protein [Planctomycetota bacterium]
MPDAQPPSAAKPVAPQPGATQTALLPAIAPARNASGDESTRREVRAPAKAEVSLPGPSRRLRGFAVEDEVAALVQVVAPALTAREALPRYTLTGKVGKGTQGTVFRVLDRDCHREVALKVLARRAGADADDEGDIARFVHEAQITAQLEHPGIVPVHDLGCLVDGTLFYSMKLVQGLNLHDWLKGRAGMADHRFELIELFLRICQPMSFAHSRGVIHRDLKPRNIMVGAFGEVMVMDWGLSRLQGSEEHPTRSDESSSPGDASTVVRVGNVSASRPVTSRESSETVAGTAIGTPSYMSPEQARGETTTLDQRADVYGLGVILYEMLTGVSPYLKAGTHKVLEQVRSGQWTRVDARETGAMLPRALVAIVHRAMALEPGERYASVDDLAGDLRAFLAGDAVSARAEAPLEAVVRVLLRHRRTVRAVIWSVVAVVVLVFGLWRWHLADVAQRAQALRGEIVALEKTGRYDEARGACERLIALSPHDGDAHATLRRIEGGMRDHAERERQADATRKADHLVAEGTAACVADHAEEADFARAAHAAIAALALAPDHRPALQLYGDATRLLAASTAERAAQEDIAKRTRGAERLLAAVTRALDHARRDERAGAERAIASQRHDLAHGDAHAAAMASAAAARHLQDGAASRARALALLMQANGLAPEHEPTRQRLAELFAERLLVAEAAGDVADAAAAEVQLRTFDVGGRDGLLSGRCVVSVRAGAAAVSLRPLISDERGQMVVGGDDTVVEAGTSLELFAGPWLATNAHARQALRLVRCSRHVIDLPQRAPPAGCAWIPAGTVLGRGGERLAEVGAFALMSGEITCGDYAAFVLEHPDRAPLAANGARAWRRDGDGWVGADGARIAVDQPVTGVTPDDARAYAAWRARRDRLAWRLPTADEWLLAAQGGDGRAWPWGGAGRATDCSPQGVRALAGGAAELALDPATGECHAFAGRPGGGCGAVDGDDPRRGGLRLALDADPRAEASP